ncbi:hypothetical protein EDB19DRAFT_159486 [Suillus lakei]|nr:hypothetical protein EDB19DRAFT_159486 [Suillus lakei]
MMAHTWTHLLWLPCGGRHLATIMLNRYLPLERWLSRLLFKSFFGLSSASHFRWYNSFVTYFLATRGANFGDSSTYTTYCN